MFKYLITGSLFFWSLLYGYMLAEDLAVYVPGTNSGKGRQVCVYLDARFKTHVFGSDNRGRSLTINGCRVFQHVQ